MTKKQKRNLRRIIISAVTFFTIFFTDILLEKAFDFPNGLAGVIKNEKIGFLLPFFLYFPLYIFIGYRVLRKAFINLKNGKLLDENFLMILASLGAFALGIYSALSGRAIEGFEEACAVILFYEIGEWFQSYATAKSRKSILALMNIKPEYANLVLDNGETSVISPENANIGDIILVKPGEKIALDGIVIEGVSSIDAMALTGESLPKEVATGSEVLSGTINLTSTLKIKVTKTYCNSTVYKILDLVENASDKKSKSENFISVFAKFYTPIVVVLALMLAVIPPIFTGKFDVWIYRALSFLVVSCPCALVVSVPLTFFAGLGSASNNGILVKGSCFLEKLNDVNHFAFDKTGTLTKGKFSVTKIFPCENSAEILKLCAIAEQNSNHPIAKSIVEAYHGEIEKGYFLTSISGKGVLAVKGDTRILCGNQKLMQDYGIKITPSAEIGSAVYIAKNGEFLGYIVVADTLKENSAEFINYLANQKCKTTLLSGDSNLVAQKIASELNISSFKAELLPQDKVNEIQKIISSGDKVAFVGDGVNDAPALMLSDVGISMGALGSDVAIESSDVVLMNDDLSSIITARKIAKKTIKIVKQNVWFSLIVKFTILALSAFGLSNMWLAVLGDVGVAFIAILNALRASKN